MHDDEIDDLIEMYLRERRGLVRSYWRWLFKGYLRNHAFFLSVSMEDAKRIRDFMPIFWEPHNLVSNEGICHIIEHLLDTE